MAVFWLSLFLVGLCVIGLGVNILFRKKEFPKYDVGSNPEMRRRGIRCYKDEDAALHRKKCTGDQSDACKECKIYELSSNSRET